MIIEKLATGVRIVLSHDEARLLGRALERASFIDTPVEEQERIQEFCARALETLAAALAPGPARG